MHTSQEQTSERKANGLTDLLPEDSRHGDKDHGEFPLVVSVETSDGGKGGTKTEVPRRLAAKLLVEGQARLAYEGGVEGVSRGAGGGASDWPRRRRRRRRLQLTVLSSDGA